MSAFRNPPATTTSPVTVSHMVFLNGLNDGALRDAFQPSQDTVAMRTMEVIRATGNVKTDRDAEWLADLVDNGIVSDGDMDTIFGL